MKKIFILFFIFLFVVIVSCKDNKTVIAKPSTKPTLTEVQEVNPPELTFARVDSFLDALSDRKKPHLYVDGYSGFARFQTFDEFEMRGVGRPSKSPFVFVKSKGKYLIVKSSSKVDSVRIYEKIDDDVWYSHMEYELWKAKNYTPCKCEGEKIARVYDRYFYNDTILELQTSLIDPHIYKDIFVKTKERVVEFRYIDIDFNMSLKRLRSMVNGMIAAPDPPSKYGCIEKQMYIYEPKEDKNKYYYYNSKNGRIVYEYNKLGYGFWGLQPGVDETNLIDGCDTRACTH